jgi:hypothetical protein
MLIVTFHINPSLSALKASGVQNQQHAKKYAYQIE